MPSIQQLREAGRILGYSDEQLERMEPLMRRLVKASRYVSAVEHMVSE